MFVLITVSLIYTMQRAELAMTRRAEETSDLYRARIVMERCFSTMLTSEQPPPPKPGTEGPTRTAGRTRPADPKAGDAGAGREALPPVPRIILTSSDAAGAAAVRLASGELAPVPRQRLELVVFESPVPSSLRRTMRAGAITGTTAEPEEAEPTPVDAPDAELPETNEEIPLKAIRGALELRPMPFDPDTRADSRPAGYELWWVPLPRRAPADAVVNEALQAELSAIDQPYRVASNIANLQWRFYDDRRKKTAFEATWDFQLPAYIECEVETLSGMRGEWMFEVGWGVGPEVRLPRQEAAENRAVPVDEPGRRPNTVTPPPGGGQPKGGGGGGPPKGAPK